MYKHELEVSQAERMQKPGGTCPGHVRLPTSYRNCQFHSPLDIRFSYHLAFPPHHELPPFPWGRLSTLAVTFRAGAARLWAPAMI